MVATQQKYHHNLCPSPFPGIYRDFVIHTVSPAPAVVFLFPSSSAAEYLTIIYSETCMSFFRSCMPTFHLVLDILNILEDNIPKYPSEVSKHLWITRPHSTVSPQMPTYFSLVCLFLVIINSGSQLGGHDLHHTPSLSQNMDSIC